MTYDEFTRMVKPLAVQLGAEWDLPTWKLYHKAVADIPAPLLATAIEESSRQRTKFPSAALLREMAEATRQALLKAHPYDGCAECEDKRGWREILVDGVPRMERCGCVARYAVKLETLGVTRTPLALPAAREFAKADD